jgi:hypothetical protein
MGAPVLSDNISTYYRADETYGGLKHYLNSQEALRMDHRELERALTTKGQELIRQLLQSHLDLRGPGEAIGEVREADDALHEQPRPQKRELVTLFGTVTVDRLGYAAPGKDSLHPKDAALNLPSERYSMGIRQRIAEEAAHGSFEDAVDAVARTLNIHVPKRQAEELTVRAAKDFEAFYQVRREMALCKEPNGKILVLTFDGKGVVMRKEDLRTDTRKKAEQTSHKLESRLSKGEKRNAKRMATVGAIYTVKPYPRTPEDVLHALSGKDGPATKPQERPRPENKRVMASLEREPGEVIAEIFDDAEHRDPRHAKEWVALVDGNAYQISLIKQEAARRKVLVTIVVDFIHVTEYLWKAGAVFLPPGTKELEAWVQERLDGVLQGKAGQVAGGIRRSATLQGIPDDKRGPVDKCAQYLLNHKLGIDYRTYLARGYPIATGVIEGACRHLVKDRMDVTGARWSLTGAESILRMRALKSSGDIDEYWRFHEAQEKLRTHAARYKDGAIPEVIVPNPSPTGRPRFRVVK